MPQLMRLGYKYRLRPNGSQRRAMSCFAGCCRYAWSAALAECIADYEEYKDDLELRQVWLEASSLEEANSRVYLPKIGWMRYRLSREIVGKPKSQVLEK